MDVAIAGGHGKIALRLLGLLAERGDRARGLIRNPDHAADLEAIGATAVGADLENLDPDAIGRAIAGADAVVFAAGAGPGSGPARKRTVDYGGAVKLIDACRLAKISRYLIVSAMGVRDPAARGAQMRPYYEAKLEADEALAASGLDHTIVRPGRLTDDPGTGLVEVAPRLDRGGEVPRDDVAATLLACLDEAGTIGAEFDLIAGANADRRGTGDRRSRLSGPMDVIVYLIGLLLTGLVVGALGRLVIPGKDPMSISMTILIGIAASFIAGLVWWAISGDRNGGGILLSIVFAALLVYLIRRSRGDTATTPGA